MMKIKGTYNALVFQTVIIPDFLSLSQINKIEFNPLRKQENS